MGGSNSSLVDSPTPPTTRTRPFSSDVAVRLSRGTAMLADAAQLPAAVLADEASGKAAIATIAHRADATAFALTRKLPPLTSLIEASIGA